MQTQDQQKATGDQEVQQASIEAIPPPTVGMKFETFEAAQKYYQSYAMQNGFAVNIEYRRTVQTGEVSRGELRCHKARSNKKPSAKDDGKVAAERKRGVIKKTDCEAKMRLLKKGAWFVVMEYEDKHNYELIQKFELVKFLNAHRGFSKNEEGFIRMLFECNFPTTKIVQILALISDKGGNLGSLPYITKDVTNLKDRFRKELKLTDVEQTLVYFKEKEREDPYFFYRIALDDEDRVRSMYWIDGKARRAYKHYRDCISFDATYLTNMYKMPCAPFIGIHNHNQSL